MIEEQASAPLKPSTYLCAFSSDGDPTIQAMIARLCQVREGHSAGLLIRLVFLGFAKVKAFRASVRADTARRPIVCPKRVRAELDAKEAVETWVNLIMGRVFSYV